MRSNFYYMDAQDEQDFFITTNHTNLFLNEPRNTSNTRKFFYSELSGADESLFETEH